MMVGADFPVPLPGKAVRGLEEREAQAKQKQQKQKTQIPHGSSLRSGQTHTSIARWSCAIGRPLEGDQTRWRLARGQRPAGPMPTVGTGDRICR